jgi:L-alanine-DL-glutamate epimerase-like enolase superfamily enzyme
MGKSPEEDVALVAHARKGLGDSADLIIDAGLVWDGRTAIRRARVFWEFNIFWLEEPLRPDDYNGYRKLSESTDVHIAAGEHESNRLSFLDLMDQGRIDIVQVDLARCGITEAMKIASLAHDRGLKVANHGFSTYINVMAALHWLNSIPNALIAEFVVQEATNLREMITRQKLRANDGFLEIPQEPGLGIDLDEDEIRRLRVC